MRLLKVVPYCALVAAAFSTWSLLSAHAAQTEAGSRPVVFEGALLIVGDDYQPIDNSAFVVVNNRFTAVGRKGEVQIPAGAARVDLTGKTVIPALIELHSHFGWWKGMNQGSVENYTRENILDQLDRFAYSGFAAVVSLAVERPGNLAGLVPKLRDESPHSGKPLLIYSGRGMVNPKSGPAPPMGEALYQIATEADARRAVQEMAPTKPAFIKFWAGGRRDVPGIPASIYRAIIDEARKHKLRTLADVGELSIIKDLIRSGVDGFAHEVWREGVDDELIALFEQRPEVFVMTTQVWGHRVGYIPPVLDEPLFRELYPAEERHHPKGMWTAWANMTPDEVTRIRTRLARDRRSVARLRAAGVRFGLGSDFGGGRQFPGVGSHLELENMVALGFTPMEAILAGTRNSAEILGLGQLGMVAAEKSADFVVLDANPLDNIANTRRIASVYLRGAEVNRAALRTKPGWGGAAVTSAR